MSVSTGYAFFQVETFSRVHYFMVRSDRQLAEWMKAFEGIEPVNAQVIRTTRRLGGVIGVLVECFCALYVVVCG